MQQVRLALVLGLMLASLEALTDVVVRDPAVAQLNQLFEDAWDQDMRESPVWASMLGDRRFNREWSDSGEEARARRQAAYSSALKRLARLIVRCSLRTNLLTMNCLAIPTETDLRRWSIEPI